MLRKLFSAVTVALVLVAMLWGNCLTCPQMKDAHSCCHKPRPASVSCHTQALQQFVKGDAPARVAPPVAVMADLPAPLTLPAGQLAAAPACRHIPPGPSHPSPALRI